MLLFTIFRTDGSRFCSCFVHEGRIITRGLVAAWYYFREWTDWWVVNDCGLALSAF
jgi:hypothetical protein